MSKLLGQSRWTVQIVGLVLSLGLFAGCEKGTVDLNKNLPDRPAFPGEKPRSTTTTTLPDPTRTPAPTTTTPPPQISTRIVCESQEDAPSFSSMTDRAGSSFITPEYQIKYGNQKLMGLRSPLSLVSDGRFLDMYFLSSVPTSDHSKQWMLFQSEFDMYARVGEAKLLWQIPTPQGRWTEQLRLLKIRPEVISLARAEHTVFSPEDNSLQKYNLRDLSSGSVIKNFDISAKDYGQPLFSNAAQWVILQTTRNILNPLQLGLVRLDTRDGSLGVLPALPESTQQWSAAFLDTDRIFWLEKSATQVFIRTVSYRTPAYTIYSTPDLNIYSMALLEEPNGDYQILLLMDNGLRLLTVKKTLLVSRTENFLAPSELSTLQSPVFSPWSQEVYFSRIKKGGLVGFSLKTHKYRELGFNDISFKCLNPAVGPEVVFEESP